MIDVIATTTGGRKVTSVIAASKAMLGVETGEQIRRGFNYEFTDYPFTKDRISFEDHLSVVQELEPEIAVAPDLEQDRQLEDVLEKADELKKHANKVVIVPKNTAPAKIPEEFLVGYPNQSDYGSQSQFNLEDFKLAHSVHVLGGGPATTYKLVRRLGNVHSYDSTAFLKAGMRGGNVWQGGSWTKPKPGRFNDVYELLLHSLNNLTKDFRTIKRQVRQNTLQEI